MFAALFQSQQRHKSTPCSCLSGRPFFPQSPSCLQLLRRPVRVYTSDTCSGYRWAHHMWQGEHAEVMDSDRARLNSQLTAQPTRLFLSSEDETQRESQFHWWWTADCRQTSCHAGWQLMFWVEGEKSHLYAECFVCLFDFWGEAEMFYLICVVWQFCSLIRNCCFVCLRHMSLCINHNVFMTLKL